MRKILELLESDVLIIFFWKEGVLKVYFGYIIYISLGK